MAADTPSELAAALDRAFALGRRAHPSLDVPREAFDRSARERTGRFLAALGLEATAARVADALRRAAAEDLHLAVACERRLAGAWETVAAALRPRLLAAAGRRGIPAAEAEGLADDVVGSLALPASGNDPRPLLETYAGAGSLAGFAVLLLARRWARHARSPWTKRRETLDAPAGAEEARLPADRAAPAPAEEAERREAEDRARRAVDAGWRALTPRERLVLVLKHRDGRSQKDVARVLGVGEPRVSRLVAAAVERLRAAIGTDAGDPSAFRDALARRLARSVAVEAPGSEGDWESP